MRTELSEDSNPVNEKMLKSQQRPYFKHNEELKCHKYKIWKPSPRDNRIYKQVVESSYLEVIEVPADNALEKGLKLSYVCYFKEGVSMKKSMQEVKDFCIVGLELSRFDS